MRDWCASGRVEKTTSRGGLLWLRYFGIRRPESERPTDRSSRFQCRSPPFWRHAIRLHSRLRGFRYITEIEGFLNCIRGRLQPKGILVATFYNMTHINRRVRNLLGLRVSHHAEWKTVCSPRHFENLLSGAGFRVEGVVPVDMRIGRPKIRTGQPAMAEKFNKFSPFKYLFASQIVFVCRPISEETR